MTPLHGRAHAHTIDKNERLKWKQWVYMLDSMLRTINMTKERPEHALIVISKLQVTCVEHSEYDESMVHHLYRRLLTSGMGFGAQRWLSSLQRQCECSAILSSSDISTQDHTGHFSIDSVLYLRNSDDES